MLKKKKSGNVHDFFETFNLEIFVKNRENLQKIENLCSFLGFCGFESVSIRKSAKNAKIWCIGRFKIRRYSRERAETSPKIREIQSILRIA